MTDALLSPQSFSILSGAGLIQGDEQQIVVHQTEQTDDVAEGGVIRVANKPHVIEKEDYIYVMVLDSHGQVYSEPYIYVYDGAEADEDGMYSISLKDEGYTADEAQPTKGDVVLVDYYSVKSGSGVYQIDITPDKFGGAYYLEASTLFRDRATGKDMPAEFIIPNCRVQSNFTFTMASSGDPSTFDFVMDAFPDYTRFNRTQKVLAEIQVVGVEDEDALTRISTKSEDILNSDDIVVDPTTRTTKRESDEENP